MKAGVFIGMPVYRGAEFVEETLQSILAQSYEDFRLLMSVDGRGDETIEICRDYAADPRIDLVVQETRLGWPGNLNWLIRECNREFFMYWQQDDLASENYLETLVRTMADRPDAAIGYTDVQWIGAASHRDSTPAIEGDPLARVRQHIEAIRYEPLRGLMRSTLLPDDATPIPVTDDESHQEEFVFLTKMAAAGPFIRSPDALYYKRLHDGNTFVRWRSFPEWRRRRGWISMGAGMYQVAAQLAPKTLRPFLLAQVLDRLAIYRAGRGYFYDLHQTSREIQGFVRDFVALARVPVDDLQVPTSWPESQKGPVDPEVLASLANEVHNAHTRDELADLIATEGVVRIDCSGKQASPLLGAGWSHLETWGVWTDGEEATVHIPTPRHSPWTATLEVRPYAPRGPVRIGLGIEDEPLAYRLAPPDQPLMLRVHSDSWPEGLIRLHLPDARSPLEDGIAHDARKLGIGLISVEIALAGHEHSFEPSEP